MPKPVIPSPNSATVADSGTADTITAYKYDASGLINDDIQFDNSNQSSYQYDGAGMMTGLNHGHTAGNLAALPCHTDGMGYMVSITEDFPVLSVPDSDDYSYSYNTNGARHTLFLISTSYSISEGDVPANNTESVPFLILTSSAMDGHPLVSGTVYPYRDYKAQRVTYETRVLNDDMAPE